MTIPETLRQLAYFISVDHLIGLIGIAILATWLLQTSLGRKSLIQAPPRRNNMAPYVPFIPFFIWFLGILVVQSVIDTFLRPVEGTDQDLQDHVIYCATAVVTVVGLILPLAQLHFARGLKGFGLRLRTIPRDLGAAFATLLAVWPLVLAAITVTTLIGQLISQRFWGQNLKCLSMRPWNR